MSEEQPSADSDLASAATAIESSDDAAPEALSVPRQSAGPAVESDGTAEALEAPTLIETAEVVETQAPVEASEPHALADVHEPAEPTVPVEPAAPSLEPTAPVQAEATAEQAPEPEASVEPVTAVVPLAELPPYEPPAIVPTAVAPPAPVVDAYAPPPVFDAYVEPPVVEAPAVEAVAFEPPAPVVMTAPATAVDFAVADSTEAPTAVPVPVPAPATPAPAESTASPRKKWRVLAGVVFGLLVLVLLAAIGWVVYQRLYADPTRNAVAGNCLADLPVVAVGEDREVTSARVVECGDATATHIVEARINDKTEAEAKNQEVCKAFPDTTFIYRAVPQGGTGYVLCLKRVGE